MSSSTEAPGRTGAARPSDERRNVACYVYGIVPEDVDISDDAVGVGEPPGRVRLVRHGEIGALVSEVDADRPLGRAQDLVAHERLLDEAAAEVPVLPLRFGAVMTTPEAVVGELLAPHHDQFAAALKEIEGRTQYIVRARYLERPVLLEVLEENSEARRLRDRIRDLPEDATRNERIRLGEVITYAVAAKRESDTEDVLDRFSGCTAAAAVREPTHERDAAHVAFLVESERQADFERTLEELRREWKDRAEVRLLGPMAPYDFIVTER
ncbi:GvpL/GvpF family gas vesicle protein [Microbispora sp. RL4-1S]|uniref:GvpL/GvpF family gas vesicle protein n=1 Tax=Microbispora oryzae TaxID=2806554 RepID=A0A940WLH7_9ACTN|nr:GvpL/GvpF family gas vesicle protein [Microbispora oryzae]MBP2707854.1 GvpL/GvpF family gas vesicle protein [Microbispora oryzae]